MAESSKNIELPYLWDSASLQDNIMISSNLLYANNSII